MVIAVDLQPSRQDADLLSFETSAVALIGGKPRLDQSWQNSRRLMLVTIDPDLLACVGREVFDIDAAHLEFSSRARLRDSLLSHIMASLLHEHGRARPDEHYATALGRALAAHLIHVYAVTKTDRSKHVGGMAPRRLRRVTDHVELHLHRTLCLARLAEVAGMSPWHFSRAFKQATGETPHRYVMARRVLRAKRLLEEEDLPILDIALAVGCVDHSHLTRVFRRATGMTPSTYRNALASLHAGPAPEANGKPVPMVPSRS